MGFTGYSASGASTWTSAANVVPSAIEIPSNFKVLLDSWNMKINVWLPECVYKRVTPKGKKPGFAPSVLRTRFDFLGFGILLCRRRDDAAGEEGSG